MEAAATEQVGSGNWSSARSTFSGISASDEDMQVVLHFISNVDGPGSLVSTGPGKESLPSAQAGLMNQDSTVSFSDSAVFSLSKHRSGLLEKFFLAEEGEGDEVLKVSSEAESGLRGKSGMPEKVSNESQAVGLKMLVQNRAQSIGTELSRDTEDTERNGTLPRAPEFLSQSPKSVECSKEHVVRRCSTVHNNPASTADKASVIPQQPHHETLTAQGQVAEKNVESLQETSQDSGARGFEKKQFPIPSRATNEGDGSGGSQISSQQDSTQQHRSLHREAGCAANRVPPSRDGFNQENCSREEYYVCLNKPVVRLKQKVLPSSLEERNEPDVWPVTVRDKVQEREVSDTSAEGICREDRCSRAATNLKAQDLIQIDLGAARDRDNRKSSAGRQWMPNLTEERTRKLSSSSQQAPEDGSQLRKQDSYPLFVMVDRPTHISDVPFMDKAQLDTLSTVHSARHGHRISQLENSNIMTSEIQIVEPTSEKTCTLSDFLSLPRPSTQVVTLRQVLRQPERGIENWKRVEPVDSKMKRRSHNKPPLDTGCYCHVPNYTGRSVGYRPKSKRKPQKNKLQLGQILGGQDSCDSRTVNSKSTSLPYFAVPSSVGRYSFADKDVRDYCPQTRSRSESTSHQQTSSTSMQGRCKEELGAVSRRGEMRLRDENASSWKCSPPMNSGRRGRRQMDERILSDFPRILGAIQASRGRQGICMVNGKQSDDARCGNNQKSSVRNAGCAACEALDSSNRRLSLSTSSFDSCAGGSYSVGQRYPSLSGADWISQAADEHSAISPRSCSKHKEGPVETLTRLLQTCPASGPDYWSSILSLDPNYRIQNVEMFLQEHQDFCTCGHNHSSTESPSDKEVLTRSDVPHLRRSLQSSPGLDLRLGKWSHYTDVGFFEGIVGLAVTSLRHFCACLINCRHDFINYGSQTVTALLHDLLPGARFARAQDRHIGIQACLNDAIFGHFNDEAYGLESQSHGFPSPRFRKEFFLEKFHRLSSLFPEQGTCVPHKQVQTGELQDFYQFCRSKLSTIQKRMGLKIEAWPRLLLHTFFQAMKQVLRVHKLAFSMEPPVTMLCINKGTDFNHHYMEVVDMNSMIGHFVSSASSNWNFVPRTNGHDAPISREFDSKVEFMVTPGFELKNRIIKSQVYLQPKQC